MELTLLLFAGLSVLVNYPHTYWAMDYVSNVKERAVVFGYEVSPKVIQNYIFCTILSTSIMCMVVLKLDNWAAAACIVEIVINTYYVYCSFEEKYKTVRASKSGKMNPKKLRGMIGAYFFGALIPVCIFVFSYLYVHLDTFGK